MFSVSAVCTDGDTIAYSIWGVDSQGVPNGDWETGIGTWNTGNLLTRTTVQKSSRLNAVVDFNVGNKRVANVLLASQLPDSNLVGITSIQNLSNKTFIDDLKVEASSATVIVKSTSDVQDSGSSLVLENGSTSNKRSVALKSSVRDVDSSDSYFSVVGLNNIGVYEKTLLSYDLSLDTWDFLTENVSRFTIAAAGAIGISGAYGAVGQVLTSAGSGAPPTWETPTGGGLDAKTFFYMHSF